MFVFSWILPFFHLLLLFVGTESLDQMEALAAPPQFKLKPRLEPKSESKIKVELGNIRFQD